MEEAEVWGRNLKERREVKLWNVIYEKRIKKKERKGKS